LTADVIGDFLELLHYLFVLVTATAVEPGAKDRDDFEDILHQIFLKAAFFGSIDDHHDR
jgi:hypothetical protein